MTWAEGSPLPAFQEEPCYVVSVQVNDMKDILSCECQGCHAPDRGMRKVPYMCICMSSGYWDTLLDWMAMSGASLVFKYVEVLLAKWHDERSRGCATIMYTLPYRAIIILGYTYKYARVYVHVHLDLVQTVHVPSWSHASYSQWWSLELNIFILHSMLYSSTMYIYMRCKFKYDEPLFMTNSCTLESSYHLRTPGRYLSSKDW